MDLDFLSRSRRETLVLGCLLGALLACLGHVAFGAGIAAGAAWGAANLWALGAFLLVEVRRRQGESAARRRALRLALVKFPLLYGCGYALLRWGWMSPVSLLTGFSLMFVVWVAEAARELLRELRAQRGRPDVSRAA